MENKQKILLVVDTEDWCFFNIASNFQKQLKHMHLDIVSITAFDHLIANVFLFAKDYDVIHFFWRGYYNHLSDGYAQTYIYNLGLSFDEFIEKYVKPKTITTAVYDHKFLEEDFINDFSQYVKAYYTSSKLLKDEYSKLNLDLQPSTVIADGVNTKFFKPKKNRFKDIKKRPLVIGWVGNSKWKGKEEDHKGLNTIIKPVVEELIKEGYNLELFLADSNIKMRTTEEMAEYFNELDLYVCASLSEGTPNPILESFSCGIPVITTNVGIVGELFGEKQKEYILKERSKKELKKKIIQFIENIDDIEELSKENLKQIKTWDWKYKALQFEQFIYEIQK